MAPTIQHATNLEPLAMTIPQQPDAFTIERRGGVTVISATPALETIAMGLEQQAADLIFNRISTIEEPLILFDLSQVDYFGSVFLAVLLRCWKMVMAKGGTMALSGVSARARELLHLTSLDFVWPIYADRREAVEALSAE
jgi:anti-sigma B factor antagonist